MKITKEKIVALVGAVIFHILLIVVLFFSCFYMPQPEELEGVPVMFGSVEVSQGVVEPPMREVPQTTPKITTPPVVKNTPQERLVTQTDEPSIEVANKREEELKRKKREEQEIIRKREEARKREEELALRKKREQEAKSKEISSQMAGLFGEDSDASRGSNEKGEGVEGSNDGNVNQGGKLQGKGGIGSYDLGGRSLGRGGLIQPKYSVNDYGTVVVNIVVDPNGNVIESEIGRGTNTPSTVLRNEALRAAKTTKFNAVTTLNNQKGTITYKFNLN